MLRKDKMLLCGILVALAIAGLVIAQNNPLEEELARLEQELNDAGYSWLVDYNGDIGPKIEVYEKDGNELIALFENLRENEYNKVYLTNLGQGQCYDDKTEILTNEGWKLFSDVEDERVMTLNQETGESEWQIPTARQEFEHDGEMYKIVLSNYSESSEEISLSSSSVENILTLDCCLNAFSSDQIGILCDSAKAKYGSSFIESLCGDNLLALNKNSLYSPSEISFTSSSITENVNSNSPAEISENLIILSLSNLNSSKTKYGEISLQPRFNNSLAIVNQLSSSVGLLDSGATKQRKTLLVCCRCLLIESFLKNENNTLASAISSLGSDIFSYSPCLLATLFFNSSDSSWTCSSVNFDLDIISSNIENFTSLTNCLTNIANASFNFGSNSDGTSNFTIISSINGNTDRDYINVSPEIRSSDLIVSPEHKVYASVDGSDFALLPIKEVYLSFNENKEIYFLDENNARVKVVSIEKEPYSGKIYDVDVGNDVVLVRRNKVVCDDYSDNKEKEDFDVPEEVSISPGDYAYIDDKRYINFSPTGKKERAIGKAQSEENKVSTDSGLCNENNYINFSAYDGEAEDAPDAQLEEQRSNKSCLHRPLGSIPSWGDSALSSNCRVVEGIAFWSGNSEGYSQDTFDLRVVDGSVGKINSEILQKKRGINEIRKKLNNDFINNDIMILSIDNKMLTVKNGD